MGRRSLFCAILILCFGSLSAFSKTRILILGDSITEGYGVAKDAAYPALLQAKLIQKGKDVDIVNGGFSGATTASGVSRLRWYLKEPLQAVVVALGANDGLRGISVSATEKNLEAIVLAAKEKKLKVILAGMKLPPNYGPQYVKDFEAIFPRLSKKESVPLIPFLLDGVGGQTGLNQEDGIHPNEKGHRKIADVVLPYLEKVL